jgi:hypothetical protein
MPTFAESKGEAGGLANLQCHVRSYVYIGSAANTVGAKILARHE